MKASTGKKTKKILITIGCVIGFILLFFIVNVLYIVLSYHRIEDNQQLEINRSETQSTYFDSVKSDVKYTIGTYNLGFGAYTPDYSFFMDGGTESRCSSKESAASTILGACDIVLEDDPDFVLFQEIDRDSTRSYHVNQDALIRDKFNSYNESFAVNYDSAYLFYPFIEPIGKSLSGISFFSKYEITSSLRRQLYIAEDYNKYIDLDRCYTINRIKMENSHELVIFNVHLSAYGNNDTIRDAQTSKLFGDMSKEVELGNNVICGGDFNHNLLAPETNDTEFDGWAYPFPRSKMNPTLTLALDDLSDKDRNALWLSCRTANTPYIEGSSELTMLDGFIVSKGIIIVDYTVKNTGFKYSDHEEVVMTFKLP